jgi:hypothetical protein
MQVDDLTPGSMGTMERRPINSSPDNNVRVDYDMAHKAATKLKEKQSLLLRKIEDLGKWGKGSSSRCRERKNLVLRQLLEAQVLLGLSIDLMRDCLMRYQADGYKGDVNVVAE